MANKLNIDINNFDLQFFEVSHFGKNNNSRNLVINSLEQTIDVNQALDLYKKRHDNPALINKTKNYMNHITKREKLRLRLKKKLEDKKNKSSANSE